MGVVIRQLEFAIFSKITPFNVLADFCLALIDIIEGQLKLGKSAFV